MQIRWTQAAIADLVRINDYLTEHHPSRRQSTMQAFHRTIYSLRKFSSRGRIGAEEGTRELLFPPLPYIAVYREGDERIEVLRIYHGAQARR